MSRWAWLSCVGLSAYLITAAAEVQARDNPRLDVSALSGGTSLIGQTFVLEDRGGRLTLADVQKDDAPFVRAEEDASFGFTRSAIWVRFETFNPSPRTLTWLLELAYAHLDTVELTAVQDDGTTRRWRAGDQIPFGEREVDVPTFVFPQEAPPGQKTTYYLRVRGDGTIRIPLRAFTPLDFVSRESQQNLILWLFYGIVAAMTLYNLGTAALLKRREYIYYLSLLSVMAAGIFTLSGQMFQYVLPNQPALANRALGVCLALGLLFVQLYAREVAGELGPNVVLDRLRRSFRWTLPLCVPVLAAALFAPHPYAQLCVFGGLLLYLPAGAYQLLLTLTTRVVHLRLYALSFLIIAVTIPVALLAHAKVIPPYTLAIWAGHIGCAAYSIVTSLSLPMRVSDLGHRLAGVNQQLSDNVDDLKQALARAEQATKVKDEFIATMSHELRTPLNAIINVPQGLLADFEMVPGAVCGSCKDEFLLDPGETVDADTACPACSSVGTLRAEGSTVYVGRPAHTARFLRKIERSGHHLLQMVNGVLDFSKMEAGRLELSLEPVDLRPFLIEIVDHMNDMAQGRGITIALTTVDEIDPCFIDPVRLRQVLLNLLSNAIKFSGQGSTLFVRWERDADADRIEVVDSGIGIAAENHERIFASFEQVHKGDTRGYGGTGLGLSISRSLVRMHGGELWVESKLGEGSTFTLTIPRSLEHSSETSIATSRVA